MEQNDLLPQYKNTSHLQNNSNLFLSHEILISGRKNVINVRTQRKEVVSSRNKVFK